MDEGAEKTIEKTDAVDVVKAITPKPNRYLQHIIRGFLGQLAPAPQGGSGKGLFPGMIQPRMMTPPAKYPGNNPRKSRPNRLHVSRAARARHKRRA